MTHRTCPPREPSPHRRYRAWFAKFRAAARRIKRLRRPGIIYCATTTAVDEVSGALGRARIPVTRYHGKMRAADRDAAQRQFMSPSRRLIMVATSAFGMGIDKPNIRYVLHYQAPGSLEQYVQEIGRAGRDGHPAHCILLFDPADLVIQEHLQALSRPGVRHLDRLEAALAWTGEERAPTPETLAYSAGVPTRICEVLLSDLEEGALVERDQEGGINIAVPPDSFKAGVRDLVTKLKTFRYEGERRLRLLADYAQSQECRSVFPPALLWRGPSTTLWNLRPLPSRSCRYWAAGAFTEEALATPPKTYREFGGSAFPPQFSVSSDTISRSSRQPAAETAPRRTPQPKASRPPGRTARPRRQSPKWRKPS